MCLAILRPPGKTIPLKFLQNASINNPHGMGLAYAKEGKLIVDKGYFAFPKFLEKIRAVPADVPLIIHFRAVSRGIMSKDNCHPFWINPSYAVVHNGTIPDPNMGEGRESDTADFTKRILRPLFNQLGDKHAFGESRENYYIRYLIAAASGSSRMIILRKDGQYMIVGEGRGQWLKGIWYSNLDSITLRVLVKNDEKKSKTESRTIKGFNDLPATVFNGMPKIDAPVFFPPDASQRDLILGTFGNLDTKEKTKETALLADPTGDIVGSAQ